MAVTQLNHAPIFSVNNTAGCVGQASVVNLCVVQLWVQLTALLAFPNSTAHLYGLRNKQHLNHQHWGIQTNGWHQRNIMFINMLCIYTVESRHSNTWQLTAAHIKNGWPPLLTLLGSVNVDGQEREQDRQTEEVRPWREDRQTDGRPACLMMLHLKGLLKKPRDEPSSAYYTKHHENGNWCSNHINARNTWMWFNRTAVSCEAAAGDTPISV